MSLNIPWFQNNNNVDTIESEGTLVILNYTISVYWHIFSQGLLSARHFGGYRGSDGADGSRGVMRARACACAPARIHRHWRRWGRGLLSFKRRIPPPFPVGEKCPNWSRTIAQCLALSNCLCFPWLFSCLSHIVIGWEQWKVWNPWLPLAKKSKTR